MEYYESEPLPTPPDEIDRKAVVIYVTNVLEWYRHEKNEYESEMESAPIQLEKFQEKLDKVKKVNRELLIKEKEEEKLFPTEEEEDRLLRARRQREREEVDLKLKIENLKTGISKCQKMIKKIEDDVLIIESQDEQLSQRNIRPQDAFNSVKRTLLEYTQGMSDGLENPMFSNAISHKNEANLYIVEH